MKKKILQLSQEEIIERNEKVKALQPEGKTLFVFVPAVCPICGEEGVQKYFKSDVFTIDEKGLDLRPLKYTFKDREFKKYHPSLHYIWQCPKCFFSADEHTFEDPAGNLVCSMNNFRKRLLENYQTDEKFKKVLSLLAGADASEVEGEQAYFTAIKEYLLSIYQFQSISAVRDRDALVLARTCMRLAWLYQDLAESKQDVSTKILVDQLKYSIIHAWEDVPLDGESALKMALKYYDVTYFASTILADKKMEPQILQVIGRLNIILGNIKEGRNVFLKGIMVANEYKREMEMLLKDKNVTQELQEELLPKMHKLDSFVTESQDLLYESKLMLKKQQG